MEPSNVCANDKVTKGSIGGEDDNDDDDVVLALLASVAISMASTDR
jgi:hypothetical protein